MDSYKELAEQAAQSERDEAYKRAYSLWLEAASHAVNEVNRQWALNRADFCSKPRAPRAV